MQAEEAGGQEGMGEGQDGGEQRRGIIKLGEEAKYSQGKSEAEKVAA